MCYAVQLEDVYVISTDLNFFSCCKLQRCLHCDFSRLFSGIRRQKILFFYFPIDLEIKVEENVIQSHAVQNAHRWGEEDGSFLMCTYEMYICSHVPEIRLI